MACEKESITLPYAHTRRVTFSFDYLLGELVTVDDDDGSFLKNGEGSTITRERGVSKGNGEKRRRSFFLRCLPAGPL